MSVELRRRLGVILIGAWLGSMVRVWGVLALLGLCFPSYIIGGVIFNMAKVARKEGHEEGHEEGFRKGYSKGHEEGRERGHEEGYQEGYDEGHEEGKQSSNVGLW